MNNNILTSKQEEILNLLSKKSFTRAELGLLGFKSSRRDLRFLERLGLITHKEKYLNNQVDKNLRRLRGTRYFIYSLVK